MIELIESTLAAMYDAVIRGACYAITFGVVWVAGWVIVRNGAKIIKAMGAW